MNRFLSASLCALTLLATTARAQDAAEAGVDTTYGWKNSAAGNLNLSQAYFDNWSKGGTDALSWDVRLEGVALDKREQYDWESKGKAVFGQSRLQGLGTRKSLDELMLETIYTYKLSTWLNPFASMRFQSQFAPGYKYNDTLGTRDRIAGPFDPAYLTQTLGLGRSWQDAYKVRVGGTLKETWSSASYAYADDADTPEIETFKIEPGASFTAEIRKEVMENILFTSLFDVFANFKGTEETDVRWENALTAKVNRFVSANAAVDVLYDRDVSTRRQVRQSLGIGISFLTL